jgi:glycosyltransferase involved in cell wall biosynthesis
VHVLIIPSSRYVAPESPLDGVFQRDQVHALAHAGVRVGVIAPKPRSLRALKGGAGSRHPGRELTQGDAVPVYRFPGRVWIPERTPVVFGRVFVHIGRSLFDRYVEKHGVPDLLHAHNALYAGTLAVALKRHTGLPVVLTEHSSAHLRQSMRGWQRKIAREAFEGANARIAVSPALCRVLEAEYGTPEKRWTWIPNVLNPFFEDQDEKFSVPGGGEQLRFLAVGSLKPVKNHRDLITAFSKAFGGDYAVQLRIAGSGPLRDELVRHSKALGVSEQVHFLGHLDRKQVLSEMRTCDVFVLSSMEETFGVALIEALSCGRPVVATACGGPEDIVEAGDGLLVSPSSPNALCEGLKCIRETIEEYDPRGIRARCVARFGRAVVAKQLMSLYQEILPSA